MCWYCSVRFLIQISHTFTIWLLELSLLLIGVISLIDLLKSCMDAMLWFPVKEERNSTVEVSDTLKAVSKPICVVLPFMVWMWTPPHPNPCLPLSLWDFRLLTAFIWLSQTSFGTQSHSQADQAPLWAQKVFFSSPTIPIVPGNSLPRQ